MPVEYIEFEEARASKGLRMVERLTLPAGVEATRCGELALRGKDAPVTAYGLAVQ